MKKKVIILALSLVSFFWGGTNGAFSFLSSGFGARALGMGGAFTALADDSSAMYWNPAGISVISIYKMHFTGMFLNMDYDRVLGYAAVYERLESGAGSVGLSVYYFGTSGLDARDENGNSDGEFAYTSGAIAATYANKIFDWLKAGLNLKCYYASCMDMTGKGFGGDLGLIAKPFGPYFSAGLAVKDINMGVLWNSGRKDFVSTSFILGAAQSVIYERFTVAGEIETDASLAVKYRAGGEYILSDILTLRLGINQGSLSSGLGVVYDNYRLDYAFLLDNNGFADLHRVSFSAEF